MNKQVKTIILGICLAIIIFQFVLFVKYAGTPTGDVPFWISVMFK